jgi:C-terminal processing protease CtpA/Prc
MKSFLMAIGLLAALSTNAQPPNTISPTEKIYGVCKFWQEVNYNFIYLNKVNRSEWEQRFKELIAKVPTTANDYAYYRELQKFCAFLKDGHTNVYFPKGIEQLNSMFGEYRLFVENVDNRAIIVRTNLSKQKEIPIGSEIIEVNGLPTQTYIEQSVAPYIASSTSHVLQNWATSRLLQGLEGETFHIKIRKPDGTTISLALTHQRTAEEAVYPAFEDQSLLDFKWVRPGIAYLALNSFADEKIDSLFMAKLPELYAAKGLIVDLRNNGGGSTSVGTAILQYLTNDTLLYGSRYTTRQHLPSFKAWGKFVDAQDTVGNAWNTKCFLVNRDAYYYHFDYQPVATYTKAKRLVVPTALLIGHNTASAAEDFLISAHNQKHIIKIGGPSFGSTGQPYVFDLPGGGSARVCTKKDTYPDGREFVGYGVQPDIAVAPTLQDYLNKKDPVLDRALVWLQQQSGKR